MVAMVQHLIISQNSIFRLFDGVSKADETVETRWQSLVKEELEIKTKIKLRVELTRETGGCDAVDLIYQLAVTQSELEFSEWLAKE